MTYATVTNNWLAEKGQNHLSLKFVVQNLEYVVENRMESLRGATTGSAWASMGIIMIANLTIARELTMLVILFLIIGSVSGVIETFVS